MLTNIIFYHHEEDWKIILINAEFLHFYEIIYLHDKNCQYLTVEWCVFVIEGFVVFFNS